MKIRDCAYFIRGVSYQKSDSTKTYKKDFVPIIRANNIADSCFCLNDLVYVPKSFVDMEQMIFRGDIIITMSSGSKSHVGKIALAKKNLEAGFGAFCGKLKPFGAYPPYLSYLLQSCQFRKHIEQKCKGTNINNIKQNHILDFEFDAPSLPEQERIVAKIEELFSQLDAAVAELNSVKEKLAVYRQSVLKEAFEEEIKKYLYSPISLKNVVDGKDGLRRGPFGGAIKKSCFVSCGYKVYEQGNAIHDTIDYGKYFISGEKYEEMKSFHVLPHDFLVSCSGTLGKITELPDNAPAGIINQALLRIRLDSKIILNKYFIEYFRSAIFQRKIFAKSQGSAMQNLVGIKEFKEITINIPSRENQQKLLEFLSQKLSICDNAEQTINTALQQAAALRQSILKQAFEGNL